jgi:hypothetical protein
VHSTLLGEKGYGGRPRSQDEKRSEGRESSCEKKVNYFKASTPKE